MTEADEKLARLLRTPITPVDDPQFVDATERRLRRYRHRALAFDIVRGLALMALAWISVAVWKQAAPLLEPFVPQINLRFLGAPAPVLAALGLVGLFWLLRRPLASPR